MAAIRMRRWSWVVIMNSAGILGWITLKRHIGIAAPPNVFPI